MLKPRSPAGLRWLKSYPSRSSARSTRHDQPSRRSYQPNDGDHAAKVIQEALGIESDEVANYVFPKAWPSDPEQRARIIGEWLQTETRFLA